MGEEVKCQSQPTPSRAGEFPRISRPFELIRTEYDVVVIGSGYGGGVAASRMSRGGKRVCVLERGREKWPGEYPTTLKEALPELHTSGEFTEIDGLGEMVDIGDPVGLYHLIVGGGQNAFCANGLGGTSLLNANVFLKADAKTIAMKVWPKELRTEAEWTPYYDMAAQVLQPTQYPEDWPELPKLSFLERQAKLLGREKQFYRAPQTTRFVDGPNSTGVLMNKSRLTGMDSTGLNDGSKNTTLVTYLSDAWNWGAEIFCECEVRYIAESDAGGYNVYFAWHGGRRGEFNENLYEDLLWIHAKEFVFMGAGSLGTTEILLRSKENGLELSDSIGEGMSGNGDILSFGYNCDGNVNAMGREVPQPDRPIGPTITGIIDCRDAENPLNGYVIEEGAVPGPLVGLLQTMLGLLPGKIFPKNLTFREKLTRSLAGARSRFWGPYHPNGSIEKTQVYLIMSHDSNQAVMTLTNDRPVLKFMGVGRSEHVRHLNNILAEATNGVGGTLVNNPFFATNRQEITVHPVGGACLSADGSADFGATTHLGELLTGEGKKHHKGLVVVDGALIPTALGANPFATITALAERSLNKLAVKHNIKIDYGTSNGELDMFGEPAFPLSNDDALDRKAASIVRVARKLKLSGLEFTEVMEGHMLLGPDVHDFEVSESSAKRLSQTARFFLTMHAWEESELIDSSEHSGMLTGTFTHGGLPASPYMVLRGKFQLFNDDPRTPETRNLTYNSDMVGTDGRKLHLYGYKVINDASAMSLREIWKATTTLYTVITDPAKEDEVVSRGILHVSSEDFTHEIKTLLGSGSTKMAGIFATFNFVKFFTRNLLKVFLGPFGRLQWPLITPYDLGSKRPPADIFTVTAEDNVESPLPCWEPSGRFTGRKPLGTIFLIPGASVSYEIFSLPTIKHNAVEYFTSKGFRCYSITHRLGYRAEAKKGWTGYDARKDVLAAMAFIRTRNNNEKFYVMGHCLGAVALQAGFLDGTIPCSEWVNGISISQVSFTPKFAFWSSVKARSPIPLYDVYKWLSGQYFDCDPMKVPRTLIQRVLDQVLRFYPIGPRAELCNDTVCHRCDLPFGRLWCHDNLNEATHRQLNRFMGGVTMHMLRQLVTCGNRGELMTNDLKTSLVNEENLQRLRGVPMLFFAGQENAVWAPENTDTAYSMMRDRFGPDLYERSVFKGKGHLDCWMSDKARDDVWRRVLRHARMSYGIIDE